MHAIRKKYAYNHVHDATLLQNIFTKLAGADGVRALRDAPAPNAGTAHSVANLVSFLNSMMLNSDTDSEYTESTSPQEAPSRRAGQMHVEQKIKGIPFQVDLR